MKQFYDMSQRQVIEPFMAVEVSVPFEFSTEVQGGLISREGAIVNVEGNVNSSYIEAEVPLANMFGYISELRSKTEGKGDFTMEFKCYKPVSSSTEENLIAQWDEAGRVYKKKFHTD